MLLSWLDWSIIVLFLLVSLGIGIYYTKSSSKSISDFFLGGRNIPWWIAGTSMVATTFAADTPLAVTELVGKNGIAGNWFWWNMLFGGMFTVFFFARYWRRAGVLTELELIELRYSGKEAAFLRGFRAVYLGLFFNTLIIGWVNLAMVSILQVFFDLDYKTALLYTGAIMLFTAFYSSLSGLKGVAVTDVFQFIFAMLGCIILAFLVVNSTKISGITGLKEKLPSWSLNFFPVLVSTDTSLSSMGGTLAMGLSTFFAYLAFQWWASWYPGAEPGGGGYIVQRMLSVKNEKHSVYSVLLFQIAHYCIRPWPWIIVGLCALVLYPDLDADHKKLGYIMVMKDFLPVGLKGLLLGAFLAAYMSTISTQLNWGASYIINDLYKRFVHKGSDEKKLVSYSRIATLFIMVLSLLVTTQIQTISGVWSFMIECGAGLGLVLMLRWYWWRINAWSEITATLAPFAGYAISKYYLNWEFPDGFYFTIGFTTFCWLLVTFLTHPVKDETLINFYQKIRPAGFWHPIIEKMGRDAQLCVSTTDVKGLVVCWLSAVLMGYSILFFIGKMIFQEWTSCLIWMIVGLVSFYILKIFSAKTKIFSD